MLPFKKPMKMFVFAHGKKSRDRSVLSRDLSGKTLQKSSLNSHLNKFQGTSHVYLMTAPSQMEADPASLGGLPGWGNLEMGFQAEQSEI